jgi:hypothetical protein
MTKLRGAAESTLVDFRESCHTGGRTAILTVDTACSHICVICTAQTAEYSHQTRPHALHCH